MKIPARVLLPLIPMMAMLAACNLLRPTPAASPIAADTLTAMPEAIVYYYFVDLARDTPPQGSVVIMPEAYILAPAESDLIGGPDTAANLRTALDAVIHDGRNGWRSSDLEIVALTFGGGHANVVLQGEVFGVGDVTLVTARMQILMTVFANGAVQSAAVTLNGDTIGNLGVSNSLNARPSDYVFTRIEIETFMNDHAYASP